MIDLAKDVCLGLASSFTSSLPWWVQSLFISTTSFFNAFILFFMMYLWTMNRQTHLKKTKGSNVPFKTLQGSATVLEDEEDDDLIMEEHLESAGTITPGRRWSKLTPLKSDLRRKQAWVGIKNINIELDDDEQEFVPPVFKYKSSEELTSSLLEQDPFRKKRSLLEIAAKVKVFSYLGVPAMKESLTYAEYIDVAQGGFLFERGKFDGSLFVVVSGRIQCCFHEYPLEDVEDGMDEKLLTFTSGPGDVVTPLLALLSALVWAQKARDRPDGTHEPLAIATGVSAIATAENTRLICIPPTCFVNILEKFPSDVYRVAQTILCRTQRVTLQTLVKTLGLHKELVRKTGGMWELPDAKEKRLSMPEWQRIQDTFASTDTPIRYGSHSKRGGSRHGNGTQCSRVGSKIIELTTRLSSRFHQVKR